MTRAWIVTVMVGWGLTLSAAHAAAAASARAEAQAADVEAAASAAACCGGASESACGSCAVEPCPTQTCGVKRAVVGMGHKFLRGTVNTLTGIAEIPMQTYKGFDNGFGPITYVPLSKTVGTVLGFFRGLGHGAGRMVYGAAEVASFFAPNHASSEGFGIPFDAEYVWEMGERYSVTKPNLKEGLMPYPRKFARGLSDGLFGVLEVPGQVVQGAQSENPWLGVPVGAVRGVWFAYGRTVCGVADAVLFLVPNPETQVGYGYDHVWPWEPLTESF